MANFPSRIFAAVTVIVAGAALAAEPPIDPAPPAIVVRVLPATPPDTQALICKSSIVTGSLIAKRKQCLTKSQWRYVDDVQRQQNQQLFDDQRTKSGCGGAGC